jgi:phosphoserine aminotransferase
MTIYNFSAGPAVLPKDVLQQVQAEMVDWHGSGMSVMEMSHRGKEFMGIAAEAEADLRELMGIPANYKVLFLQGGASSQFAMVPMNLLRGKASADYLNTGEWSKKAIKEAKRYGAVNVVASSEDKNFSYAPAQDQWKLDSNAAYVHYTPNETIGGVEIFAGFWNAARRCAAGSRHVVHHSVAADRRLEVRCNLRRCTKKYRPGWSHHRHCA